MNPLRRLRAGVDLGEVGGVNGLFRVTEPGDGTDADQRAFPPGTADRSQQRANGGSPDGNDDAQPPAEFVDQRADSQRDDRAAYRHPGGQFGLFYFAPAKVIADFRQQCAEKNEIIDGEDPGEESDPCCEFGVPDG